MMAVPSASADIERYYRNTYVKFKGFGDLLFYIQRVTPENITGVDENGDDFVLTLSEDAPYQLDYILPNRALFQYKDRVAMLQRIPARQYKRGLCPENVRIIRPGVAESSNGGQIDISFDSLKVFVNKPQYRTLKEAVYSKTRDKEVALTPRAWFSRLNQALYFDRAGVAAFNRDAKRWTTVSGFKEEVQALVSADPFPCEVV